MNTVALFLNDPVRYDSAVRLQEVLQKERLHDRIPDVVLFLEHPPVITLGRRARTQHLLVSEDQLRQRGVELHVASRGGDITYHAPGQLVVYPILKLGSEQADAHGYLANLEEIALRTASDFGVDAFRREGMSGAWTTQGKLAAIGFRLKRWVTMHGMSFNVDVDLAGFSLIVGCGLDGEPVTSLGALLGSSCPRLTEVRDAMAGHVGSVLGRRLDRSEGLENVPTSLRELISLARIH